MHLRNAPSSLAMAACLATSAAQSQQALVSVDLSDVSGQLAQRNGLDESLMPLSMLVPADVASRVCGMPVGSLALTAAGCRASSSSVELDELVKERMKADEPPPALPASGLRPD